VAIDPETYPVLRLNRTGPLPALPVSGAGPGAPPRTRIFPFAIQPGSNLRTSRSTPRLQGPSIITGWHFAKTGTPDGVLGFGLGKATQAVTETGVAPTVPPPFTMLFEGLAVGGVAPTSPNNTTAPEDVQTNLLLDDSDAKLIVPDLEWFLVVYAASGVTASPDALVGYVTVLEGVSQQALANFL